jgi:hypothetical protein
MQLKIAASILLGATSLFAQCNTQDIELRTFSPWQASFYYPSANGNTLNQYVDVTVDAPVTVNQMFSTSYDQAAGATTPPDQVGNVAEVRIYTFPVTHMGAEASQTGWTHVTSGEMTIVAWSGDCVIANFKDPVTGAPTPFVMPAGTYGLCVEYIPTSWSGTVALPQTNVPLLSPGSLSCLGVSPVVYPVLINADEFIELNSGAIQTAAWQTVDAAGALAPNIAPSAVFNAQPNLAWDYAPDANAARSESVGAGCYELPFMLYEWIPENTTPIDLIGTQYTAILTPSANGGFYTISQGGIPYAAPPAGATNLTMGGTGVTPVANSSGNMDDCTFSHTLLAPMSVPNPAGTMMTELGINSNGKVYFDTVAPSLTSFAYNGSNYGGIAPFRDLATQWSLFNTDLDPSTGVGDVYVMEPSPNYGGVMIWWDNVPNWPAVAGATNSFSIEFTADGSVCNIAYGSSLVADGSGDLLVGFSAGNGEPEGIQIDWSAIPGSPGAQVSGDGSSAPTLTLGSRPVMGAPVDMILGNLPDPILTGVPRIGLFVISTTAIPGGLDLGTIGMPGCLLYQTGMVVTTGIENVAAPGEVVNPFAVPGNPAFSGFDLYVQGAALHSLLPPNALGLTLSNGVCMTIGTL